MTAQLGAPTPVQPDADRRATRAVIDLDRLHQNVTVLRSCLNPGTEMMAVVKANAYGHGARWVAQTALAAGATRLGVATVQEGRQLRTDGIRVPILVLSPIAVAEAPLAIAHDLEVAIGTEELLTALLEAAETASAAIGVHVKVDTGMHRYGAAPELAIALAARVAAAPSLRLAGLMTHFATADEPTDRFTDEQATLFKHCVAVLEARGIRVGVRHMANSAATLRDARFHGDLVRIGIAMYGLRPAPEVELPSGVRPVLSVRSTVGRTHSVLPPCSVGYGRTYAPTGPEQVALIPIGYGDGYRRGLSNRGWMALADQRADVV